MTLKFVVLWETLYEKQLNKSMNKTNIWLVKSKTFERFQSQANDQNRKNDDEVVSIQLLTNQLHDKLNKFTLLSNFVY